MVSTVGWPAAFCVAASCLARETSESYDERASWVTCSPRWYSFSAHSARDLADRSSEA